METVISQSTFAELIHNAGFPYQMLRKATAERDEVSRMEFPE